jgi:undecaprenyl phosphate-alpha-L-ara4N flippase subunit ArnE
MKDKRVWLLISLTLMLMVFGQVMAKKGAAYSSLLNIFVLMGYTALFLRGVIWIFVLKKLPISAAYPYISLSFVLVLLASYWFFGEEITIFKGVGSILIISGIILTSIGNKQIDLKQEEED